MEDPTKLREQAERVRRNGYTGWALLLEADAWIAEHPEDETFRVSCLVIRQDEAAK